MLLKLKKRYSNKIDSVLLNKAVSWLILESNLSIGNKQIRYKHKQLLRRQHQSSSTVIAQFFIQSIEFV